MTHSSAGQQRRKVNFKPTPAEMAKAQRKDRRREARADSGGTMVYPYACAVIAKGVRHLSDPMGSPRNNPIFAGLQPNGNGRHAKKRRWLAKAHRG